jgi:hypothetical protein
MPVILVSQKLQWTWKPSSQVEKEGEGSFTHYWQLKDCLLIVHAAWQAKGQLANCLT